MMNSTNTPRNTTRRAIGLGLAVLSMSLLGTVSRADNTTAVAAKALYANTGFYDFVATAGDKKFYMAYLFANRSYEISYYVVQKTRNVVSVAAAGGTPFRVATDSAFSALVTVTQASSTTREGQMGNVQSSDCCFATTATVTPTTSGEHFIELSTVAASGSIYVSLRETTLFSPWLSKAAGFEGFIELHNNTKDPVNVTLKGYDSTGTLQGAGLTFAVPGNATVFKTGADIGVPVGVAAGVVLTHDGAFGSISGNITTLNGANGLSFDSPFTPRTEALRIH